MSHPAKQTSEARLIANQANAQLSTGPTSETGKAASSLNALKTGLTGRTVLLPGDDAAAYQAHIASFLKRHDPSGDAEQNLVQSLADTEWCLLRIPTLEMGIYALARFEFAELFPNESETVRHALIDAKTFLVYQRQLNNLSIQEGRLRHQREKDAPSSRAQRTVGHRMVNVRRGFRFNEHRGAAPSGAILAERRSARKSACVFHPSASLDDVSGDASPSSCAGFAGTR